MMSHEAGVGISERILSGEGIKLPTPVYCIRCGYRIFAPTSHRCDIWAAMRLVQKIRALRG
jgi:hypothetical protein